MNTYDQQQQHHDELMMTKEYKNTSRHLCFFFLLLDSRLYFCCHMRTYLLRRLSTTDVWVYLLNAWCFPRSALLYNIQRYKFHLLNKLLHINQVECHAQRRRMRLVVVVNDDEKVSQLHHQLHRNASFSLFLPIFYSPPFLWLSWECKCNDALFQWMQVTWRSIIISYSLVLVPCHTILDLPRWDDEEIHQLEESFVLKFNASLKLITCQKERGRRGEGEEDVDRQSTRSKRWEKLQQNYFEIFWWSWSSTVQLDHDLRQDATLIGNNNTPKAMFWR